MQKSGLLTFPGEPDNLCSAEIKGFLRANDDGQHWNHLGLHQRNSTKKLLPRQSQPGVSFCLSDQGLYAWTRKEYQTLLPQVDSHHFHGLVQWIRSGTFLYGLAGRTLWFSQDSGQHLERKRQTNLNRRRT